MIRGCRVNFFYETAGRLQVEFPLGLFVISFSLSHQAIRVSLQYTLYIRIVLRFRNDFPEWQMKLLLAFILRHVFARELVDLCPVIVKISSNENPTSLSGNREQWTLFIRPVHFGFTKMQVVAIPQLQGRVRDLRLALRGCYELNPSRVIQILRFLKTCASKFGMIAFRNIQQPLNYSVG